MKLNFSLHFRTFMTGAIIFLSLVILLISLPEVEYSIFEDILDEESGFYMLLFSFCLIFFSYGIGMMLEIISNPFPRATYLIKHLDSYFSIFTHTDSIIQKSEAYKALYRIDVKGTIGNLKVYKYIFTYIISQNDNLNREIQGCIFRIYAMLSLLIAAVFLLIAVLIQFLFADIDFSDAPVFNVTLVILLMISIVLLYRAWQKSKRRLLDEMEQAYYVLTKFPVDE
ncbi:hypothetical protein [Phocaeicola sp.]|uniref:hypothetical protein n=1 Tax=Phocaeicola sp. TaxID=2773926 RepID=UPI003A93426A